MTRYIILITILFIASNSYADTISARIAAWKAPVPPMKHLVQAFMRVAVSEAGFYAPADENLHFQVFDNRSGYALKEKRPERFMHAMAAYSNRTFPPTSPYLPPELAARTNRQRWISGINLDCTRPPDWDLAFGERVVEWDEKRGGKQTYEEMCIALRKRTWQLFKGERTNWCEDRVDHWGGAMDIENPRRGKWVRVQCDDPSVRQECDEARKARPNKPYSWPTGCTRNIGWCDPGRGVCNASLFG